MTKGRLEAFSDGVIAIIITIMVLEMEVPHGADWGSMAPLWPVFVSYVLSFIYVGIYWNNHHHLMHVVHHVDGRILWANLHPLFWLSLVPFVTRWMGETNFAALPVAVYGVVLFFSGAAYFLLTVALVSKHGRESLLAKALGEDIKGKVSVAIYAVAISLAFKFRMAALFLYVLVAIIWFVPDKRIEKVLSENA